MSEKTTSSVALLSPSPNYKYVPTINYLIAPGVNESVENSQKKNQKYCTKWSKKIRKIVKNFVEIVEISVKK